MNAPQDGATRVRAVIVNYNASALAVRCAQSLLVQRNPDLEIVVVDNCSSNDDWRYLQQHLAGAAILHRCATNLGYAGGINAGARLQTDLASKYILVLNSDITLPAGDSIRRLIGALQENPRRVACSPLIRDRDSPTPPQAANQVRRVPDFWTVLVAHSCWLRRTYFGRRLSSRYHYEDRIPFPLGTALDCETINGACFLIDRDFLEQIGYLDARTFLYMEELILGASIRARRLTACLCTAVVADHIQGASTGMHGQRRPLRRELQQIQSELVYLRHYSRTSFLGQGLFALVRAIDLILKAACLPVSRIGNARLSRP